MVEVIQLSGDFLSALEASRKNTEQAPVGEVFMTFAPRIRTVYAEYCRNNDNALALHEKVRMCTVDILNPLWCIILCQYMDTPSIATSIHHSMDMLR